ncbi:hypothetical protein CI15_07725 [Paraburkholderia monticola]|uniref:Uncharacterized protein n=1 Tax=Paraburkholderia monticola TaxID=1399968 RepID=A0A149PYG8_9BURK|nr:hypothetical protein [Paraburkholderia monticola]KXU90049.1 hypothetical protein CI15_07725 [Paraburkholderia monticola]
MSVTVTGKPADLVLQEQWLTAEQIHALQKRMPARPSSGNWDRRGNVDSVTVDGRADFPGDQFDRAGEPQAIVREILARSGLSATSGRSPHVSIFRTGGSMANTCRRLHQRMCWIFFRASQRCYDFLREAMSLEPGVAR